MRGLAPWHRDATPAEREKWAAEGYLYVTTKKIQRRWEFDPAEVPLGLVDFEMPRGDLEVGARGFWLHQLDAKVRRVYVVEVEPRFRWDGMSGPGGKMNDTASTKLPSLIHDVFYHAHRLGLIGQEAVKAMERGQWGQVAREWRASPWWAQLFGPVPDNALRLAVDVHYSRMWAAEETRWYWRYWNRIRARIARRALKRAGKFAWMPKGGRE